MVVGKCPFSNPENFYFGGSGDKVRPTTFLLTHRRSMNYSSGDALWREINNETYPAAIGPGKEVKVEVLHFKVELKFNLGLRPHSKFSVR